MTLHRYPLRLAMAAALMCVCFHAAAQPPGAQARKRLLEKYDADRDGRINEQERETIRKDVREGRLEVPPEVRKMIEGRMRQGRPGQAPGPARVPDNVIAQRDVKYGRAGDTSLKLDIYRPKEPKAERLPAIVFIHGGGWRGGDKNSGAGRVLPLVAEGNYVGASVNYRLSGEATWPAQIHDCKAAIRWIRANAAKYGIDPDKIGVWGGSAGGHLVNMLGTSGDVKELEGDNGTPGVSSRVTCVVPFCGPANLVRAEKFEGGVRPSAVDLLLGGPIEENEEKARQASPVTYASQDDPPFLLFHGTADKTVPFAQAETMYKALKDAGVNVKLVRIVDGGHGIFGAEVDRRVKAFLDKHLRGQNVEVSDEPIDAPPAKPQRGEQ
jgi:acetyl esterase/lipase